MYKCSYVEVIAAMLMRSWSRTGRPLRKIHFSNDNVFFPFVVDVLFVYHRQDLYRTWLWDECIISETGAAYSSRTHGFNPPVFWFVLLIFSVFRVFLLCFCCLSSFCFVCPILLVSLDYSFLIASSVFSNDYFFSHFSFWFTSTRINKTIRSFII